MRIWSQGVRGLGPSFELGETQKLLKLNIQGPKASVLQKTNKTKTHKTEPETVNPEP